MNQQRTSALTLVFTFIPSRRDVVRGLAGAGIGWAAQQSPDPGEAKRKRKRKKKKPCQPCKRRKKGKCKGTQPDGSACPGGACMGGACQTDPCPGQQRCEGECIPTEQCCTREDCPAIVNYRCCNGLCTDEKLDAGRTCTAASECCSDYCRLSTVFGNSSSNTCDATCRGKPCTAESGCCRGFSCVDVGSQNFRCGGCLQQADHCGSNADCCFSDCTASPALPSKQCLSYPGGPCEKDVDCRSCFRSGYHDCSVMVDGTPVGICQNGVCVCPDTYECCSDADCKEFEFCDVDDEGLRGECKPLVGP